MRKHIYLFLILLLVPAWVWSADLTVCASGCDGTVADFEAGNAPFDALSSDTVTFTDAAQSDKLSLPASFGASEGDRATLVFTGVTITDDAETCLETNGRDYITITGGTFAGGNGSVASIEIESNSLAIILDGVTVNPGTADRGIRVWGGCAGTIIRNSSFDGGTDANNLIHLYVGSSTTLDGVTISDNTFVNGASNATNITLYWGATSAVIKNITVSGNTMTGGKYGVYGVPAANTSDKAYGIDIDDNTFTDTLGPAIRLEWTTSTGGTSYIRNNIANRPGGASGVNNVNGIRTACSDAVITEWNTSQGVISNSGDGNGIIIDSCILSATVYGSDGAIVRNNITYGNTTQGGAGISNYQSDNSEIYNNLSYGNKSGISWGEDSGSAEQSSGGVISNNTLYGNTEFGGKVRENALGSTWTNNIAWGNTTYGFALIGGGAAPTSTYNDGEDYSPNDATYDLWTDTNGTTADPLFYSATDFRLKPGSPCIKAGVDVDCASCTDLNGNVVTAADGSALPRFGEVNIGAYWHKQMGNSLW